MPIIDELKILVTAEVSKAIADLNKAESQTKKLGSTFAQLRDIMQGPVAAFQQATRIIGQVINEVSKLEDEWKGAEQSIAKLGSVVRSTGAETWTSTQKLLDYAEAMQSVTTYTHENIEESQAVLLGFRNISGVRFDAATKSILDMATVMKMDLVSATQAIGKALDNPIQGMDGLSRQGFKFTEQEKALIKSLQESGHLMDAQDIILKELTKTFGGASEAVAKTATGLKDQLKIAVGEINEEIGRSISNNLKPWREKWLAMAQAIGAAAKAQNDFRDAMDRASKGGATTLDKLTIARMELAEMQKQAVNSAEITGGASNEYTAEAIRLQIEHISRLEDLQLKEENRKKTKTDQAAKEEADAKKAAEIAAKAAEFTSKKMALEIAYGKKLSDISYEKLQGWQDEETANKNIQEATKDHIRDIRDLGEEYGATAGNSKEWYKDLVAHQDEVAQSMAPITNALKDQVRFIKELGETVSIKYDYHQTNTRGRFNQEEGIEIPVTYDYSTKSTGGRYNPLEEFEIERADIERIAEEAAREGGAIGESLATSMIAGYRDNISIGIELPDFDIMAEAAAREGGAIGKKLADGMFAAYRENVKTEIPNAIKNLSDAMKELGLTAQSVGSSISSAFYEMGAAINKEASDASQIEQEYKKLIEDIAFEKSQGWIDDAQAATQQEEAMRNRIMALRDLGDATDNMAEKFKNMVASMTSKIGEMMIVAGLERLIDLNPLNDLEGWALLAGGGGVALAGGLVGSMPSTALASPAPPSQSANNFATNTVVQAPVNIYVAGSVLQERRLESIAVRGVRRATAGY